MGCLVFQANAAQKTDFSEPYEKIHLDAVDLDALDFHNGRSAQYKLQFPKAPIIHTYNPTDQKDDKSISTTGLGVPVILLNAKIPNEFRKGLPDVLKTPAEKKQELDQLDLFWIVQNNPWNKGAALLMRPHYWTDPDAPYEGIYSKSHQLYGFIADADGDFRLASPKFSISVHPADQKMIVSSPAGPAIVGSIPVEENFSFWSLLENGPRTAITLHWILKDEEFDFLKSRIADQTCLDALFQDLLESPLKEFSGFKKLAVFLGITKKEVAASAEPSGGEA